jgi:hypothetical protein
MWNAHLLLQMQRSMQPFNTFYEYVVFFMKKILQMIVIRHNKYHAAVICMKQL